VSNTFGGSDGCETHISSDFCNCGACGHSCDPCFRCVDGHCLFAGLTSLSCFYTCS
jgi:hypothetical protein